MSCEQTIGRPRKDSSVSNATFSSFSSVAGRVCNLNVDVINANTVNTGIINTQIITNVPLEDIPTIRLQLAAPFTQNTGTTFLQNNVANVYVTAQPIPVSNILNQTGTTVILLSPGEIQVLEDGVYSISYTTIFDTYSGATQLPLGIPGSGSAPPGSSVSGTTITYIVINNVNNSIADGLAPDYFNFQTLQPPLNSGASLIPLNAGDVISVYNLVSRNNSFQAPGDIITRFCDVSVVKVV